MKKHFVLNDQSVINSHGFKLLSRGGDFSRFTQNPVMLYQHEQSQVIGRWVDLTFDGDKITATPEFDMADPAAAKVAGQVERDFIKGASLGIVILEAEYNYNNELTVTKWEALEASVVAIPSNSSALSLKIYDGQTQQAIEEKQLAAHLQNVVQLSLKNNNQPTKTNKMIQVKLTAQAADSLGLADTEHAPEAISAAVATLAAAKTKAEAELQELKDKAVTELKAKAEQMVNLAVQKGKIAATQKDAFIALATSDFASTEQALAAIPEKTSLKAQLNGAPATELKYKTRLELFKADPAEYKRLQAEDPEAFKKLK